MKNGIEANEGGEFEREGFTQPETAQIKCRCFISPGVFSSSFQFKGGI